MQSIKITAPVLVIFLLLTSWTIGYGQTCNGNKPADTTCPGGCTELSDGDVDFTDTRCVTGSPAAFSSETRVGTGTLIVCGTLTMGSGKPLKVNSGGTLHIAAGGKVIQGSSLNLDGSRDVIVYGEYDGATNSSSIQVQGTGANNLWIMGILSAADLVVNNTDDTIFMYDNSATTVTNFKLQGAGGKVCMEGGAKIDANRIEGNSTDGLIFGGPAGEKSCVGISGGANQVALNSDLTASDGLNICLSTGTTCSPCNYGSATTSTSCASCGAYLPVELLEWNVAQWGNGILGTWSTASETNNDFFLVERSLDGIHFELVATIEGAGTSSDIQSYSFMDEYGTQNHYYRLSQFDYDGTHVVFNVAKPKRSKNLRTAEADQTKALTKIWQLRDYQLRDQRLTAEVFDQTGRSIAQINTEASATGSIDLTYLKHQLAVGIYQIQITGETVGSVSNYVGIAY